MGSLFQTLTLSTHPNHRFVGLKMFSKLALIAFVIPFIYGTAVFKPRSCDICKAPTYPPVQGLLGGGPLRELWLPYCLQGQTINYCQAMCSGQQKDATQGSCQGCEAKCGMVFTPVCSEDQTMIYPNKCQAECSGVESVDCTEIQTVIPGKTKLPPNNKLPKELQSFGLEDDINNTIDDEDV